MPLEANGSIPKTMAGIYAGGKWFSDSRFPANFIPAAAVRPPTL